jgi:hypothetical protein
VIEFKINKPLKTICIYYYDEQITMNLDEFHSIIVNYLDGHFYNLNIGDKDGE